MTVARKLLSGTLWISMATVLGRLGTFLGNLAVIRLLSKNVVGELGLIESWLNVAVMFATFGINTSVAKYVAEYLERQPSRVGKFTGAAFLLTLLGVVAASLIVLIGFNLKWWRITGKASEYAPVLLALVAVLSGRAVVNGLVYGIQEFSSLVTANTIIGLSSFPALYLLTWWHGLPGTLEARLMLTILETGLLARIVWRVLSRRGIRIAFVGCFSEMRQLTALGVPVLAGGIASGPVQPIMMTLLASQPGGLEQVALITTATRLCSLVNFLPTSVASILTPILAGEWGTGDRGTFGLSLVFTMRVFWLVSFPPILFVLAASPTLITSLYGQKFYGAWPIAFLLLVVAQLTNLNQTADRAFLTADRIWLSITNNFLWLLLFVPLALWWIPRSLGLGYAGAFLVTFLPYVAIQMCWLHKLFRVEMRSICLMLEATVPYVAVAAALAIFAPAIPQTIGALSLAAFALAFEWRFLLKPEERRALEQRFLKGLLYWRPNR